MLDVVFSAPDMVMTFWVLCCQRTLILEGISTLDMVFYAPGMGCGRKCEGQERKRGHQKDERKVRCPATSTFPKFHIIDLSRNHFFGSFPAKIIQKWKSRKASNESQLHYEKSKYEKLLGRFGGVSYDNSYSFTIFKRMAMVYQHQKFYNLIVIDISSNNFNGEIPDVLGDITGIVLFNLSNNLLSGNIPSSLEKLSDLEAVDLSLNHLSGRIPRQLVELTLLSYFNNNLSGPIPQSKQFGTFESSFFEGNQGLCGNQLFKKGKVVAGIPFAPPSALGDDEDSGFFSECDRKIVLIGYGGGRWEWQWEALSIMRYLHGLKGFVGFLCICDFRCSHIF
ncbi:hypothetical protein Fmac_017603 [Flemingia macrophylla]|uniref:Uncharacterized protein n=1 Tax=Flemingia macrophylla TaxID=520843 RepID=A0ABD1M2K3_9FABA